MKPSLRWALVAAYAAAIFALSGIPRLSLGGAPRGSDKIAHLVGYCLFSAAIWYALAPRMTAVRAAFLAAVIAAAYGATDEVHQYFVPGRYAGAGDWMADAAGAFVWAAAVAWRRRRRLRREARKRDWGA
jgi:VanZ family protein